MVLYLIYTFKIKHYRITTKKLNNLHKEKKIVFLSDLHNYCYGKHNEKLVKVIKREQPDLILVAGDMIVGKPGASTRTAEEFMVQLPKICDVYYSNGNHEQRMKEDVESYGDTYECYKHVLEEAGVHFLSNVKIELVWDENEIEVYGLELPNRKFRKFKKHTMADDRMVNLLGTCNHDKYNILIAHSPSFMEAYLRWGADLVVSGHFHGGVVRLPGIGGVITPNFTLFPKYSGEMTKKGEASVVVSKGLGLHTIPVRLFNPAEVVVLHVNGTEE